MEEPVEKLLAAARLVRDSQEASDDVWTDAHELLYAAIRNVEAWAARQLDESRPARRGSNWRPTDLNRLPDSH